MNTKRDAIIKVLVKHGGALTAEEVMDRMDIKTFYKGSTSARDVLEDLEFHLYSLRHGGYAVQGYLVRDKILFAESYSPTKIAYYVVKQ